jgi:predicted ATPase
MRHHPYLLKATFRPDAAIDFARYPFNIPAVQEIGNIEFHPGVTFFVGENGAGKSTVLEGLALALGFSPEGGTLNVRLSSTEDSTSTLHSVLRLARSVPKFRDSFFLRAETLYNLATYMDADPRPAGYGERRMHRQSHGELFLAVLVNKLKGQGLYLLDEPEAALSPTRQLAALRAMHGLVLRGSQFIIATHSPILLSYPGAKIYQFDSAGLAEVNYEDLEHVVVTRDFLNNREMRVKALLDDVEGPLDGAAQRM